MRFYAVALVVLAVVPTLVLAAFLAQKQASSMRAEIDQHKRQTTRELSATIDRELRGYKNMLIAMATSKTLRTEDLTSFGISARTIAENLAIDIVVHDPRQGRQVLNTALAPGAPLDELPVPTTLSQATPRDPAVSNLTYIPTINKHCILIQVPVIERGVTLFTVSFLLTGDHFLELMRRISLINGERAFILDGDGIFIARSIDQENFVGSAARPEFFAHATDSSGEWSGDTKAGNPAVLQYRRLTEAPWIVAAAVDRSVVDAPRIKALTILGVAGFLWLALASAAAYWFSRGLSQAVTKLATAGKAIERTEVVEPLSTALFEANAASMTLSTASQAIRRADEKSRYAVEAAGLGTWSWNLVTGELFWSERYREIIGVPLDAIPDHSVHFSRIIPEDVPLVLRTRQTYLAELDSFEVEYRVKTRDDTGVRWVSTKGRIERDARGKVVDVFGVLQDITARKQAESERADLRRRWMSAQEQERLHLARELHDDAGQAITAALMELKDIEPVVDPVANHRLARLRRDLENLGRGLHQLACELRPTSIDDLGLKSALAHYVTEWGERSGIVAEFHCAGGALDAVPRDVENHLYRIVQEALTNARKHARGATKVSVLIDRERQWLRLAVEDNGCGFEPATTAEGGRTDRLGLAGIRERLSLIGGDLEIESTDGCGTCLFVRIELDGHREAA